jgi:hypothetical protein
MAELSHFVLTRFNVTFVHREPPPAAWLRHRLDLFQRFTLPSMRGQTGQPTGWLIFCDTRSPDWFRDAIDRLLPEHHYQPVWCSGAFSGELAAAAVEARRPASTHVVTTRLDNDDAVARDFLGAVQGLSGDQDFGFLNFTHGAQLVGRRIYRTVHLCNAFISLVEPTDRGRVRTVFVDRHNRLGSYGPVLQVKTHPMWLQVIHGNNLANVPRGVQAQPAAVLAHFPISVDVEYRHRAALLAHRLKAAAGIGAKVLRRPSRLRKLLRVAYGGRVWSGTSSISRPKHVSRISRR